MKKYVKVMFGTTSGAKSDFKYLINEVNIANNWNPNAEKAKDFGGFNYTTEDCILRWLHRGDTIYDVEIPEDAENIKLERATTIYRSNKIVIKNPKKVNDDLVLHFYKISKIPEKTYYKSLAVVSIMGYKKTAYQIINDKVNINNIDEVLEEWNDFIFHNGKDDRKELNVLVKEVDEVLNEIKSDLLISINTDKTPYIKDITSDKVINITGESGSGKSYYTNKYINDDNYIVIDTDLIFSNGETQNKYILELRELFKDIRIDYLITNFDDCYKKIIVMRTCINTCYNRCIDRWKNQKANYSEEELEKYSYKKSGMYSWYKSLNKFLYNVDKCQKV